MPIYEFYCADCHVVYNFFARSMGTSKRPDCPRCGRARLERRMSRFAIGRGAAKPPGEGEPGGADDLPPGMDEAGMEAAMEELAREAEGLDENNPVAMARMMRKLTERTGMPMDDRMQEAIRRLESGEDPDRIEEEMGHLFDEEGAEPGGEPERPAGRLRGLARRLRAPEVDETLYDL